MCIPLPLGPDEVAVLLIESVLVLNAFTPPASSTNHLSYYSSVIATANIEAEYFQVCLWLYIAVFTVQHLVKSLKEFLIGYMKEFCLSQSSSIQGSAPWNWNLEVAKQLDHFLV